MMHPIKLQTSSNRLIPDHAQLIPMQAKKVFQGEIFSVFQWPQKLYDGSIATFEMLRRPDTVIILAIDEGKIVAIDEEQPNGISRQHYLPSGRVDATDETVLAAAKRELREETGLEFASWSLLQVIQPEKKIEWFVSVWVAQRKIAQKSPQLDAGERISVHMRSYEDIAAHNQKISCLSNYNNLSDFLQYVKTLQVTHV